MASARLWECFRLTTTGPSGRPFSPLPSCLRTERNSRQLWGKSRRPSATRQLTRLLITIFSGSWETLASRFLCMFEIKYLTGLYPSRLSSYTIRPSMLYQRVLSIESTAASSNELYWDLSLAEHWTLTLHHHHLDNDWSDIICHLCHLSDSQKALTHSLIENIFYAAQTGRTGWCWRRATQHNMGRQHYTTLTRHRSLSGRYKNVRIKFYIFVLNIMP